LLAGEHDEHDLLAFRYAAGEMRPEEASAFEARLADDQEAREALSRAVGLAERLSEAAPSAPQRVVAPARMLSCLRLRRGSFPKAAAPAGWMAVGAAAALLVASLVGWPARQTIETLPGSGPSERPSPPADVLVWARLQARYDGGAADLEHWLDEAASVAIDDAADWVETQELPPWVFTVAPRPPKRGKP
jgi:hypothetical protein